MPARSARTTGTQALDQAVRSKLVAHFRATAVGTGHSVRLEDVLIFSRRDLLIAAIPVSKLGDLRQGATIGMLHVRSRQRLTLGPIGNPVPSGTYTVSAQMGGGGCGPGTVMLRPAPGAKRKGDIVGRFGRSEALARVAGGPDGPDHECKKITRLDLYTMEGRCICLYWECDTACHLPLCLCWPKKKEEPPVSRLGADRGA